VIPLTIKPTDDHVSSFPDVLFKLKAARFVADPLVGLMPFFTVTIRHLLPQVLEAHAQPFSLWIRSASVYLFFREVVSVFWVVFQPHSLRPAGFFAFLISSLTFSQGSCFCDIFLSIPTFLAL